MTLVHKTQSFLSILFCALMLIFTIPLGIEISLSFFLLMVILVLFNIYSENFFSITNSCINIFYILFFILAPIVQLNFRPYFLNTIPYDIYLIVFTNLLLSLFLLVFLLVRMKLDDNRMLKYKLDTNNLYSAGNQVNGASIIFISFLIITIAYFNGHFDIMANLINGLNKEDKDVNQIYALITVKFLYSIPAVGLFCYLSKKWSRHFLPLFLIALLVLILKNPLVEHRNGYGLIYLACTWFAFAPYINTSAKLNGMLVFIFAIFFPLGAFLNPSRFIEEQFNIKDLFINYYNTVNYDSWANVAGSIDYVSQQGFQYGYQILSTLLFWFPRAIWEGKGVASGQLLGEYMEQKHAMWMTNISFPIISEGYIDFGILGVIIFATIFAIFSSKLDTILHNTKKPSLLFLSIMVSFSFVFIMRGPLLSSFAYTVGVGLAMYLPATFLKNKT